MLSDSSNEAMPVVTLVVVSTVCLFKLCISVANVLWNVVCVDVGLVISTYFAFRLLA